MSGLRAVQPLRSAYLQILGPAKIADRDDYKTSNLTKQAIEEEGQRVSGDVYVPSSPPSFGKKDSRKEWSVGAELCLIQCVKVTDRDEKWGVVANTINKGCFTYTVVDDYGGETKPENLIVKPEHCLLYYDRLG